MKIIAILLLTLATLPALAQTYVSPLRLRGETFESAVRRQLTRPAGRHSAFDARQKLGGLDQLVLPEWTSTTPIDVAFREIRDQRTLNDASRPDFMRRLSWLFPDDGCYARAEIAAQWLEERGYPAPAKIFIFGNLKVKTEHHPNGKVQWWYHVVVGYKTANGLIVLDPAVESKRPLSLKEWSESMGGRDVTYSFCDRNSMDPYAACVGGPLQNPETTAQIEQTFLDQEWDRQLELERDPARVLGDEPPWLEKAI